MVGGNNDADHECSEEVKEYNAYPGGVQSGGHDFARIASLGSSQGEHLRAD
jgi:hypothetical protein